jgi:hypothetical protein
MTNLTKFGFVFLHTVCATKCHDMTNLTKFGFVFLHMYVRQNATTWQNWQTSVLYFYICATKCHDMTKLSKFGFVFLHMYARQNVTTWQNWQTSVWYFYICMTKFGREVPRCSQHCLLCYKKLPPYIFPGGIRSHEYLISPQADHYVDHAARASIHNCCLQSPLSSQFVRKFVFILAVLWRYNDNPPKFEFPNVKIPNDKMSNCSKTIKCRTLKCRRNIMSMV